MKRCGIRLGWIVALALATACGGADIQTTCASDADCFENYSCDGETQQCLRTCSSDTDCLNSQRCVIAQDAEEGVCKLGSASG